MIFAYLLLSTWLWLNQIILFSWTSYYWIDVLKKILIFGPLFRAQILDYLNKTAKVDGTFGYVISVENQL